MLVFTFPGGASGKEPGLSVQAVLEKQEMQETKVQSLDGDDPLEKEMVIHFSILSWRIPWTEEPGGLQSIGSHRVRHNWSDLTYMFTVENFYLKLDFLKVLPEQTI